MMLAPHHIDHLNASAVSKETAEGAGVYSVTTDEARQLGFVGGCFEHAVLSGIAFPYRDARTGTLLVTRLRPDQPIDTRKYLAPTGSRNHLYVPDPVKEQLEDVRFDVLMVEGEKKALALRGVVGTRYLVVGISGVWNWRTSDKEKEPDPEHPGSRTVRTNSRPIDDFVWMQWKGRTVYLLFDSDGSQNASVAAAEQALARELRRRGATVRVVTLPAGEHGKQGIDDNLAREPPERRLAVLQRFLRAAAPRRKLTPERHERALDLAYEPSGGFMRTFDEYVDPITDAPAIYRPFTALAILGAIVGRNVSARHGAQFIVPNLYHCILGQSSLFRKSTMIAIAEDLITMVKAGIVLPNEFSNEKLLDLLEKSPQGFFGWRELTGFLMRANRDYMSGGREFLMEIYDNPPEYRRELKGKSISIKNPALSILTASATAWLSEQLKGGDLRSGFLNRFAFVLAERKTKWYALPPPPDERQRAIMKGQLEAIGQVRGHADLRAVEQTYTPWLRDTERQIGQTDQPEIVAAFYTRLSIVALKYAVLLELATTGDTVVSSASMEEAIVLVDYLKAVINHLLRVEFAQSPFAKRSQRVLQCVTDEPGVKRGRLLKRTGFDKRELTLALDTLKEQEDIYEEDGGFWPAR